MNIKQLETFYWAARLGSFTAAAGKLNSTQSTVSMRIQDLERSFGVQLFDRSQRSPRPTAKGRELLGCVERLIALKNEIQERIGDSSAISGLVRIGVAEVVSLTWLPRLVKTMHERYPRVSLELDEALTVDLIDRLRSGMLDVVLSPGRARGFNLLTYSLGNVEFRWTAGASLKLPNGPLTPGQLAQWPIIALSPESYHHSTIERWFRNGKATAHRMDTCKSMGVAAALTAAGLGVSYLPVRCFQREIQEQKLRILQTDPAMLPVEFNALIRADANEPVSQLIAELAAEISDFDKTSPD